MSDKLVSASGDRLLTVQEVALRLRVRAGWIYSHVWAGTLPFAYTKIGRYVRVKESILAAYIEKATTPAPDAPRLRRVR